jgi:hypothetical protein
MSASHHIRLMRVVKPSLNARKHEQKGRKNKEGEGEESTFLVKERELLLHEYEKKKLE